MHPTHVCLFPLLALGDAWAHASARPAKFRVHVSKQILMRVLAQIAVLKELDGKGPFCSLVMAVVVVKDVVVIVAYAINVELIRVVGGLPRLLLSPSAQLVFNTACARMFGLCVGVPC